MGTPQAASSQRTHVSRIQVTTIRVPAHTEPSQPNGEDATTIKKPPRDIGIAADQAKAECPGRRGGGGDLQEAVEGRKRWGAVVRGMMPGEGGGKVGDPGHYKLDKYPFRPYLPFVTLLVAMLVVCRVCAESGRV